MRRKLTTLSAGFILTACIFSCTNSSKEEASGQRGTEEKETVDRQSDSFTSKTMETPEGESSGNDAEPVVPERDLESTSSSRPSASIDPAFTVSMIDSVVFSRIKGKSYPENCPVSLQDLRYLTILHYTPEGDVRKGELICNKSISNDLIDIFHNLYLAKYPVESVRLVDEFDADDDKSILANNTSCFNYRTVAGSTHLSKHAYGKAIDINPYYNPYIKYKTTDMSKVIGAVYADRTKDFPMKIDHNDLIYKEFKKHGFKWGGDWNYDKDYQHFVKE